jgi:hypothetical protein
MWERINRHALERLESEGYAARVRKKLQHEASGKLYDYRAVVVVNGVAKLRKTLRARRKWEGP